MTKTCSRCRTERPVTEFYASDRYRDGYRSNCKPCGLESARNWHAKNRGYAQKRARKWREDTPNYNTEYNLRSKFGLTLAEYDDMLAGQGGVCAICGLPPAEKRLSVDHDHATGAIRGLLHSHCNLVLGNAGDSPALLRAAADYLDRSH